MVEVVQPTGEPWARAEFKLTKPEMRAALRSWAVRRLPGFALIMAGMGVGFFLIFYKKPPETHFTDAAYLGPLAVSLIIVTVLGCAMHFLYLALIEPYLRTLRMRAGPSFFDERISLYEAGLGYESRAGFLFYSWGDVRSISQAGRFAVFTLKSRLVFFVPVSAFDQPVDDILSRSKSLRARLARSEV